MHYATVQYQIGTYSGTIDVVDTDPNEDNETIEARARAELKRRIGSLPPGAETFRLIARPLND